MARKSILAGAVLLFACAHAAPAPQRTAVAGRPWSSDILYFVLVDRFADGDPANDAAVDRAAKGAFHGGDLKGLLAHLDEIASLGVTALWINPLVENIPGFVTGAGFPDWAYHGYWADDFTRLDTRFGTPEDLRALVDACHARGIKVLLDVVYNHAGYATRYLTDPRTKGWLRSTEEGSCGEDDLTSCVAGLPDFRTEL
jgi:alpha-amylase